MQILPKPIRYYIWTIGCQMNKADSDRLESAFMKIGLEPTHSPKESDVIVLNSCVVRQSAEDKVTGMLTSLKPLKPNGTNRVLALMGCMVGPKTDDLKSKFPYVDVFMTPQNYEPLINLIEKRFEVDTEGCLSNLTSANVSVTAYVPIIHGCDKFCTFCIIPYRRGREQSRTVEDIVREVELLVSRGVKEVTLLGQNVDSYGHDLPVATDLADLLESVNNIQELDRIRFLTSHPNDMSDRIIEAVASLPKVCEHFNLPFQAGDNSVLELMRRGYTVEDYKRLVERVRGMVPNVSIGTDLIVGFPGETQEAFSRSIDILSEIEFDKVHAAAYSTRLGTIAARKFVDDISLEEKKHRLKTVEVLQESISTRINAQLLDKTTQVLVEGYENGKWRGRNRNDKLVFFEDMRNLLGATVDIKIVKTSPWSLQGIPVT